LEVFEGREGTVNVDTFVSRKVVQHVVRVLPNVVRDIAVQIRNISKERY
jgi:hypothetical protein